MTSPATTQVRELDGLIVYRFDAPLFFANARSFRDEIRLLARSEPPPHWILLAAEPITDVDTTAADVVLQLHEELEERGVVLAVAELKDPVRTRLTRYGLGREIADGHFYRTLDEAVGAYQLAYPTAIWRDRDSEEHVPDKDDEAR